MYMSLFRIPLIFSVGLANQIAWTAPNPPPAKTESSKFARSEGAFVNVIKYTPHFVKGIVWAGCLCETVAIALQFLPPSPIRSYIFTSLILFGGSAMNIHVTPLSVLGFFFATFGGFTRYACYRTLQRMFTYELSIRDDHKLITHGPYGIVRHPGYTGAIFVTVGTLLAHLAHGSWVMECGVWETRVGRAVIGSWVTLLVLSMMKLVARTGKEDEVLREEFGEEWAKWAQKVPWRLVPWLY